MDVRTILRNLLLSESDRFVIAVNKFALFTEEALAKYIQADMPKYPYIASSTKFSLPDIAISIDGFNVGWIESIVIDTMKNQLEIGHFALDKKLVGLGIGKKLAYALKKVVKEQLGVTQILFRETSNNSSYPAFFENVLGAVKVEAFPKGEDWLWKFS